MSEPFFPPALLADDHVYRLDERILFGLIFAAFLFCAIHAARRAFRQPEPNDGPGAPLPEEELERHTLCQRIFHWSNAVAVTILALSGWLIYEEPLTSWLKGTASGQFRWHLWGTALLLPGLAWHLAYESFIARSPNPMVLDRKEGKQLLAVLKNFLGLSNFYPGAGKYHAGQILFHWGVAANLFLLILTGAVIWKPFRDLLPLRLFGLGWDFIFYCRVLHGFFSATFAGALIAHIYFALIIRKNWSEARSMFTGRL